MLNIIQVLNIPLRTKSHTRVLTHPSLIIFCRKFNTFMNFRELNLGVEQPVIRLIGTCRLPRKTGRRGKRERWR